MKAFFEKYFGIEGSSSFAAESVTGTSKKEEHKSIVYEMPENSNLMMVAEPESSYDANKI